MRTTAHVWLSVVDEERWSKKILESFPRAVFIDGARWPSMHPPTKNSISDCSSNWVYVWNPDIYPTLPVERLSDGFFRGPHAGMVIHFMRAQVRDKEMRSGDLAIGVSLDLPENEMMVRFARSVLRSLKEVTSKRANQIDLETGKILRTRTDVLIGQDAAKWCLEQEDRFLKFHNSPLIFIRPIVDP